jgi:hypothetical protein
MKRGVKHGVKHGMKHGVKHGVKHGGQARRLNGECGGSFLASVFQ